MSGNSRWRRITAASARRPAPNGAGSVRIELGDVSITVNRGTPVGAVAMPQAVTLAASEGASAEDSPAAVQADARASVWPLRQSDGPHDKLESAPRTHTSVRDVYSRSTVDGVLMPFAHRVQSGELDLTKAELYLSGQALLFETDGPAGEAQPGLFVGYAVPWESSSQNEPYHLDGGMPDAVYYLPGVDTEDGGSLVQVGYDRASGQSRVVEQGRYSALATDSSSGLPAVAPVLGSVELFGAANQREVVFYPDPRDFTEQLQAVTGAVERSCLVPAAA